MRQTWLAIVVLFCFSCGTDTSEIGEGFFHDGLLDISYIDTASVKLSTIKFAKVATSNSGRLLVGSNNDTRLGRLSAASFVQLSAAGTDLEDVNATFDYLALTLKYDTYFYYDTTTLLTLNVHRVVTTVETNDDGYLYNNSDFSLETNPIGTLSFKPRPNRDDSVEVKLSDDLGLVLFQKLKNGDNTLSSSSEFIKYLKGVAIVPDTTVSSSIIGFTTTPELRLYYWDKSVIPAAHKFISFNASGIYFTKLFTSRVNESLELLIDEAANVSSDYTNNEAYIQAGSGLALRIDIPYLRELKQLENFFVTQAQLEFYVVKKSFDTSISLPAQLATYHIDDHNSIYAESATNALLIEDTDLERYTRYTIDVTTFVKEQMELQELNKNALLFSPANLSSTVNRICLASANYEYKTRLRIYYATVNNTN